MAKHPKGTRPAVASQELVVQVHPGGAGEARRIVTEYGGRLERILRGTGDGGKREFHRIIGANQGVLEALNASPAVNGAYAKPEATLPATPDFFGKQRYLHSSGLEVEFGWRVPGGKGAGVKITDIEYDWDLGHEDLQAPRSVLEAGVVLGQHADHGTATLGILRATHDSKGVYGISPAATVAVVAGGTTSVGGLSTAEAIQAAANNSVAGDIILLELQRAGPEGSRKFIPIEWWPDDYEAIKFATGKGVIVVSAGANGDVNLDNPIYDTPLASFPTTWSNPFKRGTADSGSIIVGAGFTPAGTYFSVTGTPRSRLPFSNYGSCVDVQAWGTGVATTGYGDDYTGQPASDPNQWYKFSFGGTSAASAVLTGVLAQAQGALKAAVLTLLTPASARAALRASGRPQQGDTSQRIGNEVNTRLLFDHLGLTASSGNAAPNLSNHQVHYGSAPYLIDTPLLWSLSGGRGEGVKIAVLDPGFKPHEDLPEYTQIPTGLENLDPNEDHGTVVIGIMGAAHDGAGYDGIAPNAEYFAGAVRADLATNSHLTIRAAADILDPGDIICMSVQRAGPLYQAGVGELGSTGAIPFEWWYEDFKAIEYATSKGIIVLTGSANGDGSLDDPVYDTPPPGSPADWQNPFRRTLADSGVILVGASSPGHPRDTNWGPVGSRLGFSNFGGAVDVNAWGREVTILKYFNPPNADGNWYFTGGSGTSVATPLVAGVLACIQGALKAQGRPPLTPAAARETLRLTGVAQADSSTAPATQNIGNHISVRGLINHLRLGAGMAGRRDYSKEALRRSWRIEMDGGEVMPVRVATRIETVIGNPQIDLDRAPGSGFVINMDGDGLREPGVIDVDFLAKSAEPNDRLGASDEFRALEFGMRRARAFWGGGAYEGLYLPLLGAYKESHVLDHPPGQERLRYALAASSVERNSLADSWAYPITDDVREDHGAEYAAESLPDAPIVKMRPSANWHAPTTLSRIPRGTMYVGVLTQEIRAYGIGGVGSPIDTTGQPSALGLGVFQRNGYFVAHVGTTEIAAFQNDAGGYGYLHLFAMTWEENGLLRLCSFSRAGFKDHGSVSLGEVGILGRRNLHLGTRVDSVDLDGHVFPGAPRFGAPFLSHRVASVKEQQQTLGAWFAGVHRDRYTVAPPPYSLDLELNVDGDVEMVAGRTIEIPMTLTRKGGFLGPIEHTVETSTPAMRFISFEPASEGTSGEEWTLTLEPEEGIEQGRHTVTVVVQAVGRAGDESLEHAIDLVTFEPIVRLGDPALPEGTTGFNPFFDPKGKSFAVMNENAVAGALGHVWELHGLTCYTSRWDGVRGDGTNTRYGRSVATSDNYVANMALDHSVSFAFWDAHLLPVGSVLFTLASQTNKWDYWQVYRAADGLRLRVSKGTTSSDSDTTGNSIPIRAGVMDVSVVATAGGTVQLIDPKAENSISIDAPVWAGPGRATLFGAWLSDNAVQGLSRGICLAASVQERVVSPFQLERQAELFRGYMLRTSQYDRPEYVPHTVAIWLADPGNVLRNYHPRTAARTMVAKGTATTQSGRFVTPGGEENGWRSAWIPGSEAGEPHDVFFTMRNMSATRGNGRAKMGVSSYGHLNNYLRTGVTSTTNEVAGRLHTSGHNSDGSGNTTFDETPTSNNDGRIPVSGTQSYVQRLDPAGDRVITGHLPSRRALTVQFDQWQWFGELQISIGCNHRGLEGANVRGDVTGLENEVEADCLGVIVVASTTTHAEQEATMANIVNDYDYSQVLYPGAATSPGTGDGGGTVVESSPSDITLSTYADFDPDVHMGTTGRRRALYDRIVTWKKQGGGSISPKHLNRWDDTSQTYRGQYRVSRGFSGFTYAALRLARSTKDPAIPFEFQKAWNRAVAVMDNGVGGSPHSDVASVYRGWTFGTDGGGNVRPPSTGQRTDLETGVGSAILQGAYLMHKNVHIHSSFAATRDDMLDYYRNNLVPEWNAYWVNKDSALHLLPGYGKKRFTHSMLREISALWAVALCENEASPQTTAWGQEALDGFALWNALSTTKVIPVESFKDAAWATYGGARIWGQRTIEWGGSTSQFTQPSTYLVESWSALDFMYLEGMLTIALGSQAAADAFMVQCVSGANLGVFIEPLRAKKQMAGAHNGWFLNSSGVKQNWMFNENPFGGTYADGQPHTKALRQGSFVLSAYDATGRLGAIRDEWYTSTTTSAHVDFMHSNAEALFEEVYKHGRAN